ncbi:iron chelate uptake ABC transporter family permease subunit [Stackebrandtia nassauensis]|uniref:Transport system permease protein n=1 Tax=Stackebrandtia nassauensis (strain DSM 44728 / CIP 108903 / NRRL B-16338 / NBRC 102104 / LLR-40K-21) TaxID=446470 RepID=D3Q8C0_STANL|nr:iron chelate uptake ABC transporter family permease subunit [Stackebrandtia nassauensis]ADD42494.1 transport system permease protein [Stackebrandtia nassauensis DSM 44728]
MTSTRLAERTKPARAPRRGLGLALAVLALAGACVLSLGVGAKAIPASDVIAAILDPDNGAEAPIVWSLRIPRTLMGLTAGAALGACGALIQALTRNPLADPGILGVNAGAAFAITMAIAFLGLSSPWGYVWFAIAGAFVATLAVYAIGSIGRAAATPVRMTLAGVAMSAVLAGVTQIVSLTNPRLFHSSLSWTVGSLGGRDLGIIAALAPLVGIGLVLAVLVTKPLNAWALGDDLGRSLGGNPNRVRVITITAITVLAAAATALAGPIGFVGLIVPHVVRWFTGPDQRWIVALSVVVAPVLLLVADSLGRILLPNGELRVSIVTAFLGAPLMMGLVMRRKASSL